MNQAYTPYKKDRPAVLCITRQDLLASQSIPEGITGMFPFDWAKTHINMFHWLNRGLVDDVVDPLKLGLAYALPQVLVYVLIKSGDKYLSYSRAKTDEERLSAKRSIGLGGHCDLPRELVTPGSFLELEDLKYILEENTYRELEEEVGYIAISIPEPKQVIIDLGDQVGHAHIGLITTLEIEPNANITFLESDEAKDIRWLTASELKGCFADYEGWSRILIEAM